MWIYAWLFRSKHYHSSYWLYSSIGIISITHRAVSYLLLPNNKCRQKKLCGEEDCRRCGDLDMDQPCIGKTDCSVCHSSNGVLCRACLKVRYGEELEEVRANQEWMCPHCVEEKGTKPYWICNSSFCLKKRNMAPTGIAIFKAREMGYESVAHYLMDRLRKADKRSRWEAPPGRCLELLLPAKLGSHILLSL